MQNTNQQWRKVIEDLVKPEPATTFAEQLTDLQCTQYIEAMLVGEDVERSLAGIHAYLETHPVELEKLSELLELFEADRQLEEIEPVSAPSFNLHFLSAAEESKSVVADTTIAQEGIATQSQKTRTIPEWIEMQFHAGRQWIVDQMGAIWIDFSSSTPGQSSLVPVLVTRSQPKPTAIDDSSILRQFSIGSEELDDLDLEIRALRTRDPHYCTLLITAHVPSRWPDLSGVEVLVLRSKSIRSGITDEEGQIVFEEFPVEELERVTFKVK